MLCRQLTPRTNATATWRLLSIQTSICTLRLLQLPLCLRDTSSSASSRRTNQGLLLLSQELLLLPSFVKGGLGFEHFLLSEKKRSQNNIVFERINFKRSLRRSFFAKRDRPSGRPFRRLSLFKTAARDFDIVKKFLAPSENVLLLSQEHSWSLSPDSLLFCWSTSKGILATSRTLSSSD